MTDLRFQALAVDVDARLVDVWAVIWGAPFVFGPLLDDEERSSSFASCLRTAYAQGYQDALHEDSAGRRGELCRAHGYRSP